MPVESLQGIQMSYARIAIAVAIVIFLAGTHYKAYHIGGSESRAEFAEYKSQRSAESFKASEKYREKEKALNLSNERIRNALAKEKANRAADAAIAAGKLRDFESTIDSARASDSTPGSDADDPPLAVARECARSLVLLDDYASGLASQTRALQAYARDVCLAK